LETHVAVAPTGLALLSEKSRAVAPQASTGSGQAGALRRTAAARATSGFRWGNSAGRRRPGSRPGRSGAARLGQPRRGRPGWLSRRGCAHGARRPPPASMKPSRRSYDRGTSAAVDRQRAPDPPLCRYEVDNSGVHR
jgi:hypothetical protein